MPSKQTIYQNKRAAEGKCRICAEPTSVVQTGKRKGKRRRLCDKHLQADNERNAEIRNSLKGKCKFRLNGKLCLRRTVKGRNGFKRFCTKHSVAVR